MPAPQNPPKIIVGLPGDDAEREIVHSRTVGRGQEEYLITWPGGAIRTVVKNDLELAEKAKVAKVKKIKKKHEPGAERYERNPHEPIKVP